MDLYAAGGFIFKFYAFALLVFLLGNVLIAF